MADSPPMTTGRRLVTIFRAAAARTGGSGEDPVHEGALEAALPAYVRAARSARPTLLFEEEKFVQFVGARAPGGQIPPVAHAGDVLLAFACATGIPAAVDLFHREFSAVIARVLSRRHASHDQADDAAQIIREKLLVAREGAQPKIAEYKGIGPLRSWVSTAAATTLLMIRREAGRRRLRDDSTIAPEIKSSVDPERLYLKERHKTDAERAIVGALASLSDRQRTLLRLHLSERLSIDQLAVMYAVNRATAARWLSSARKLLAEKVRDELRARLRLSESDCDSIVALVRSDLEISVARYLGEPGL
jgi:RNA polymerase sigma-70 factor (ECF subfamily)